MAKKEPASNTIKIRDLYPSRGANKFLFASRNEFDEYLALAINALKIECTDNTPFGFEEEDFIKKQLIKSNSVGYNRATNIWASVSGFGLNAYGNPTELNFVLRNGKQFTRPAYYKPAVNGSYRIQALPSNTTYSNIIRKATEVLQICDEAIIQNLQAIKTPAIMVVKDKDTRLSLLAAIQDRQNGEPVILVDQSIVDGLKGVQTYTQYIAQEVFELREATRDRLLNKLATMSANVNKRERVQVGEVNATVGQCEDYIYTVIDNVNSQFKSYGLPFKMSLNTSLEELYLNEQSSTEIETPGSGAGAIETTVE